MSQTNFSIKSNNRSFMNTVINRPKKRGISLSLTPNKDLSRSQGEPSVIGLLDQESSRVIETDRIRPKAQTITFNYLNPLNNSARLSQVIKYEQTHRRNYSVPKHEWIPQPHPATCLPVKRSICIVQPEKPLAKTQTIQIQQKQAPKPVQTPTITIVTPSPVKNESSETQKLLLQKLEEKERLIVELQTANKIQEARIEYLQKQLRSAETKGTEYKMEIDQIKEKFEKEREEDGKEKEKLKSLVMQTQRSSLETLKTKENRGERKRLDIGKMNEIQAKLNRLISDIKK